MIKILIEFFNFLLTVAPLLTSVTFFALVSILLAKTIKKHPRVAYTVMAIPALLVMIPTILGWCGVEVFNFVGVPVLGQLLRDYIHMGTLGHPLLIIIMYMGALDTRRTYVKRLMSIRKELSIIVGFPVLTHALIRVVNTFPRALTYFTNHESYIAVRPVTNELGAGLTNSSYVLGILLLVVFLPLWITSFDAVHRRMGGARWKKTQRWAYLLYALLFVHAMGMHTGNLLNPRSGGAPAQQTTTQAAPNPERASKAKQLAATDAPRAAAHPAQAGEQRMNARGQGGNAQQAGAARPGASRGFADMEVPREVRQYIHIFSILLIYASYLWLKLRKVRARKNKKANQNVTI